MEFSPLKRDIVLLIIRDYEMALIIDTIKEYLTVTTEQVFYIINYLIDSKWVDFQEGKLIITNEGNRILESSKLNVFSLKRVDEYKYIVKESSLENYIPKKL
ncbi:hypothetical protein [Neobacillus sp. 114]|uniref:hypothetical protein n=1 Tax=Neobacillus sp. 114 TaxID=3048535 RepID=UPI0024C22A81|nr:hypothetical protein [Neobacillus sp. 114]